MRIAIYVFALLIGVSSLLFLLGANPAVRTIQRVEVINFPEVQRLEGDFNVEGPISHARLLRREGLVVQPVARANTTNLVQGESVETDGFTVAILNLQGEVKGTGFIPGQVGAVLIPDEAPVRSAFNEDGQFIFPLEISARPTPGGPRRFAAETERTLVGFPRYRLFFYNETDRSVELNLYIYLGH